MRKWKEKQRKSKKCDAKHGLIRFGAKATKQANWIFHCYSIPQRTNFELPKYRTLEGIIDGGGPGCPHYLPNTIIEWWENKRKTKKKQKRWCQT